MDLFIFLTYITLGIYSGILYDILYIVRVVVCGIYRGQLSFKDKIFTAVCDFVYFIFLAIAFIFLCVLFCIDTLRLYMFVALVLGVALYLKSVHIIVAFFVKRVYNIKKTRRL